MIPENLNWELLKFKKGKDIFYIPIVLITLVIISAALFSINFSRSYFSWMNEGAVKNPLEYYFSRLCFLNGLLISFLTVLSSIQIYQSEHKNNTYIKLLFVKRPIKNILNQKFKIQLIYVLAFVFAIIIAVTIFSFIMNIEYFQYSRKSIWLSLLQFFTVYLFKAICMCLVIRLLFKILKSPILHYLLFGILIFCNILPISLPVNFFYLAQTDFVSTLIITIISITGLLVLLKYEK